MFVEGKGMPKQNSPGFGNLLIKFNVSEKKINLSDKARKVLWEELTGKKWSDRQKQTTVSEDEDVPRIRNIKELNTSSTDFDEDVDENDGPTECTHS
jgi:DnaJ-class molecular chaperone